MTVMSKMSGFDAAPPAAFKINAYDCLLYWQSCSLCSDQSANLSPNFLREQLHRA